MSQLIESSFLKDEAHDLKPIIRDNHHNYVVSQLFIARHFGIYIAGILAAICVALIEGILYRKIPGKLSRIMERLAEILAVKVVQIFQFLY